MEDETTIGGQIDFIMQHRNRIASGQLGVSDTQSCRPHDFDRLSQPESITTKFDNLHPLSLNTVCQKSFS
jgi:hypothetical protein